MTDKNHYRSLERIYLAAPINAIFKPTIKVSERTAEIDIEASTKLFQTAGAVHGPNSDSK